MTNTSSRSVASSFHQLVVIVIVALILLTTLTNVALARQPPLRPSSSSTMVLRIRTVDGSMRRVSLLTSTTANSKDDTASAAVANSNSNHHPNAETMTLSAILALAGVTHPLKSEDTHSSIQLDGSNTTTLNLATDGNKTMTELGLVHGSTITILKSSSSSSVSSDNHLGRHSKTNSNDKKKKRNEDDERFDPFPELATSSSSSRTTYNVSS